MKCNTCGYEQSGESGFCEICGAVLTAEAPQQFGYSTPPGQQNVTPPVSGQGYNGQPNQAPQGQFGAPQPQYGQPQQGQPQYGNPPPPYGAPPPQYGPAATPPPYNAQYGQKSGSATAALVFGILSLVCGGTIWAILAIIFGIKGKKECRERGLPTGTATAGLVLGIIGGIFSIIMIYYYVTVVIPQMQDLMEYAISSIKAFL